MACFTEFNFSSNILKAIKECGYKTATPVQAGAIPKILSQKDLVVSAQTGSGKTAAFVLPTLQLLNAETRSRLPSVLILTPTRELAHQITHAINQYGKYLRCNSISLVGGARYSDELRALSRTVDIVVATPGRLLDHLRNRRINLSQIKTLILDEADRMLDMGFIDDVNLIANETPKNRQTLLFSATVDTKLSRVINNLLKQPEWIELTPEKIAPTTIKQILYRADSDNHKMSLLHHILTNESIYKAIIFSGTKVHTEALTQTLIKKGYAASSLHGDHKQSARTQALRKFRTGKIQILVATDVAARGIDVNDVSHVINYDLPRFSEDYVHRIGRTGRAGKEGVAISFALPTEDRALQKIQRYIGQAVPASVIAGLEPSVRLNPHAAHKKKKKTNFKGKNSKSIPQGAKKHVTFKKKTKPGTRSNVPYSTDASTAKKRPHRKSRPSAAFRGAKIAQQPRQNQQS